MIIFFPQKIRATAAWTVAIALGIAVASPPTAHAQFRERSQSGQSIRLAQGQQQRPGGPRSRGPSGKRSQRGQNRSQRDGAPRGQRPRFDRPGEGPPDAPRGGPGSERGPGEDRDRPWQKVPQQRRQQVLKFVEEHFPRMWVEMSRLREQGSERFRQRMRRIFPDIMQMMEVNKRNPQLGSLLIRERQLDMRIRHAAHTFHKSQNPDEKKKLSREIRQLVGKVFDVQLQRREQEIAALGSRLAELKERLSGRNEMRDELIKQRAEHLLKNKPPGMRGAKRRGGKDANGTPPHPPRDIAPSEQ